MHPHSSVEKAEEDRIECAKGAYRTSAPIEVPGCVAALGEAFYEAVEAVLEALPDMECVEVPAESDENADEAADAVA